MFLILLIPLFFMTYLLACFYVQCLSLQAKLDKAQKMKWNESSGGALSYVDSLYSSAGYPFHYHFYYDVDDKSVNFELLESIRYDDDTHVIGLLKMLHHTTDRVIKERTGSDSVTKILVVHEDRIVMIVDPEQDCTYLDV